MGKYLKPYLKSIVPFVGTLVVIGVQLVITGEWDKTETNTAVTGILASAVVFFVPNTPNDTEDVMPPKVEPSA